MLCRSRSGVGTPSDRLMAVLRLLLIGQETLKLLNDFFDTILANYFLYLHTYIYMRVSCGRFLQADT